MLTVQPAVRSRLPRVALYEPAGHGGIAHYTFELAEGLQEAGWHVTVLTSEGYELAGLDRRFDVKYVFRASRLKAAIRMLLTRLSRWRRGNQPDVLSGRQSTGNHVKGTALGQRAVRAARTFQLTFAVLKIVPRLYLTGTRVIHVQWLLNRDADFLFIRLLKFCRFGVVLTVHDVLPHDEYTNDNWRYFQKLYQVPDILVVHSENIRRELLELFDVEPAKLRVIPHGAQTVFGEHFAVGQSAARRALNVPDDKRVVLFFGQIRKYKGLEYLLDAFEVVRSRCEDALLLVAGRIHDGDAEVWRHYTALLSKYENRPDVRLDTAYISLEKVSLYFAAADLVVLPYVRASQSGVLLSAYAAGRPVVVTDTGGLAEVVRDGVTGMVVPPADAAAIADAAVMLLENRSGLKRMGREARRLADTTYSWANIAAVTGSLYQSIT